MSNTATEYYALKNFPSPFSLRIRILKKIWYIVWLIFVRPCPRKFFNAWVRLVYRVFGATIPSTSAIHPSAKVFMPWNLRMGEYSVIASYATILNVAPFIMGHDCVVSEGAYLCGASHNIYSEKHEQTNAPIIMHDRSWVATQAFIGMGVTIGEGAVVGARAAVFKDVEPWTVVGGNPAKFIKKRIIQDA